MLLANPFPLIMNLFRVENWGSYNVYRDSLGYWSEPKLLCLGGVRLVCLFRPNQIWKGFYFNCLFVTAPDIAIVASMIVSVVVDDVKVDADLSFVGN